MTAFKIEPPFYPIIYVRGYAMRRVDIEETFNDSYYGFAASAVYKKQTDPDKGYLSPDLFEGQLIRFMKSRFEGSGDKKYGYADAVNSKPEYFDDTNPSRSIWISRFYDQDFIQDKVRSIEHHANELIDLVVNRIPSQLIALGMDKQDLEANYKVILIAHSMGGLVCRTVLQNSLPNFNYQHYLDNIGASPSILSEEKIKHPENIIHKLVTIGTPHKGIDMGNIPDILEESILSTLNPYDSNIFRPKRMRRYLDLLDLKPGSNVALEDADEDDFKYDLHSLGKSTFPVKNCLCIIGSDYQSYSAVKHVTGSFSDGLVKQDRAYIVGGEKPDKNQGYLEPNTAYYANVHRAHSGYKGIVNSYETFENLQRFLFGDLGVKISLEKIKVHTVADGYDCFYDFEFALTIRGTGVYLHQRKQDPCENAIRYTRNDLNRIDSIHLHTSFLNSKLRDSKTGSSHFIMKFSILEYRTKSGWLWDTQYPSRTIFSESLEVRVREDNSGHSGYVAEYSWQADTETWQPFAMDGQGRFSIPLHTHASDPNKATVTGNIVIEPFTWQ